MGTVMVKEYKKQINLSFAISQRFTRFTAQVKILQHLEFYKSNDKLWLSLALSISFHFTSRGGDKEN